MKAWPWFALVQIISLVAMIVGWVVLIPFCLLQAWTPAAQKSIKGDGRSIDAWRWKLLGYVCNNPEDGVSGQTALVQGNQPYMPNAWAPWRAYCWSAWRNSADNLKYVFAWEAGPLKEFTLFGRTHKIGWQRENGFKVPVLS